MTSIRQREEKKWKKLREIGEIGNTEEENGNGKKYTYNYIY